jgi:vacuolar-type H+-ATPase subunit C/Vma6
MRQDTNYAYAVARIKVMENRLMTDADLDTLISAPRDNILSVLSGFGYQTVQAPASGGVNETSGQDGESDPLVVFQNGLSGIFSASVKEVMKFSPEPEALSILLYPFDFANAKICVKDLASLASKEDASKPELGESGNIESDRLWNAFVKNDFDGIYPELAYASKKASQELVVSGNARKADIILDKACFNAMMSAAYGCSFLTSSYLKKYLRKYADWKNYITALRIRSASSPEELMEQAYIPGNLKPDYFVKAVKSDDMTFSGTPYEEYVKKEQLASGDRKGNDGSLKKLTVADIEELSEKYLSDHIMATKNEPNRINAVFTYLMALKKEISTIRIVTVGKRAGIADDDIRKLLGKDR